MLLLLLVCCVWPQTAAPTYGRLPSSCPLVLVPVSSLSFPLPLPVPNSHFPQFPFPSRVSNNFAVGGLKHTHTDICSCVCVCVCCIHVPDDGFITFSWHCPCPVASLYHIWSTNKTKLRLDDGHSFYTYIYMYILTLCWLNPHPLLLVVSSCGMLLLFYFG